MFLFPQRVHELECRDVFVIHELECRDVFVVHDVHNHLYVVKIFSGFLVPCATLSVVIPNQVHRYSYSPEGNLFNLYHVYTLQTVTVTIVA